MQVLFSDVKTVIPEQFVTKKLMFEMRKLKYYGDLNGKKRPFYFFCKLERSMSPRDISRLKHHMLQFFREVYASGKNESEAYDYIITKIFGRQYVGPCKYTLDISLLLN